MLYNGRLGTDNNDDRIRDANQIAEPMNADSKNGLTYRGKTFVRVLGTLLITVCCLMIVLGLAVFPDELQGPRYVFYWSWCFLVALAAGFVAVLDILLLRRASQQTRRELYRRQFIGRE